MDLRSFGMFCLMGLLACTPDSPTKPSAPLPQVDQVPTAQTVFQGMTATFSVKARGEALTYQWFRNGAAIPGATQATWTTGPLQPADSGARISVLVDDAGSQLDLPAVSLTVKAAMDLRFKGIGEVIPGRDGLGTNIITGSTMSSVPGFGIPLNVGSAISPISSWDLDLWGLAEGWRGLGTSYGALRFEDFEARMVEFVKGDSVISSMDLGKNSNVWAFSLIITEQAGLFTPVIRGSVALDQLQDFVTQEGLQGRVVTAISFGSDGHPYVLSYGWNLAPTARFEAKALRATLDTLFDAAKGLSGEGYCITALGADNDTGQGLLVVGTRPAGSIKPRELSGTSQIENGWANLGHVWNDQAKAWIWISQR